MNLVTGATGHIGNVLVRQLLQRGEKVRARRRFAAKRRCSKVRSRKFPSVKWPCRCARLSSVLICQYEPQALLPGLPGSRNEWSLAAAPFR